MKRGLVMLVIGSLLAAVRPAVAREHPLPGSFAPQGSTGGLQRRGPHSAVFECQDERDLLEVYVHPSKITTFLFPGAVLDAPNPDPDSLLVERMASELRVKPRVARGKFLGNLLASSRACDVIILLWLAGRPEDAPVIVEIQRRDRAGEQLEAHERRLDALEGRTRVPGHEAGSPGQPTDDERAARASAQLHGSGIKPVVAGIDQGNSRVLIDLGNAHWLDGKELWGSFVLDNDGTWPRRLEAMQVIDGNGRGKPVPVFSLDPPATRVGEPGKEGRAFDILPGERATGVFLVPNALESGAPRAVVLHFQGIPRPVVVAIEDWVLVPRRREDVERERLDKRAYGWMSLSPQGLAGLALLGPGQEPEDQRNATTMVGLGVRFTYGLTRMFAVEIEASGGRTGRARFEDVSWDGMQGTLERSAGLGRFRAGAMLRSGDYTIISLRAGLGVQGTSFDSSFIVNDVEQPGPKSEFDLEGFWYLGGGVERRLGDHFEAGLTISFSNLPSSVFLETALHFGYRWKP